MTKANQFAISQGIEFDPVIVSEKIEELVRLTKEVNKRDKDKKEQEKSLSEQTQKSWL